MGTEKGNGYATDCPVKQANITDLVARVGSTHYAIGEGCTFQVAADGLLEFIMNDDYSKDNFGVLAVEITRLDPATAILDSECGFRSQ